MKNGWTILNKVLLWTSIGVGILAVAALTNMVQKDPQYGYGDTAALVFFIGAFIVFAFHAFWGLLVEISHNISQLPSAQDIDNLTILIKQANDNNNEQANNSNNEKTYFRWNDTDSDESKKDTEPQKISPNARNENAELLWNCPTCGRSNYINRNACSGCGELRYKEQVKSTNNSEIKN